MAQELPNARIAAKMLYKINKRPTEVRILAPELVPEAMVTALQAAVAVQKYYEAIAISPDEGMQSPSATVAVKHHSAAAAHAAAIADCDEKRKEQSEPCVVLAEFLPRGYEEPAAFSLSYPATEEFTKSYRKGGRPKAFAIEPDLGFWGSSIKAESPEAAEENALAACRAEAEKAKVSGEGCVVVSVN